MPKEKPFTFCPRVGEKPFKVTVTHTKNLLVTGIMDRNDRFHRFTRPIPIKFGDVFSACEKKGLKLNGSLVDRRFHPSRQMPILMAWAPKRLDIAIFREVEKKGKPYWVAMDVRGYWLGVGDTLDQALHQLLHQLKATDFLHREERGRGRQIVRWHCHKTKGARAEMREAVEKALKGGMLLRGVDWRSSVTSKYRYLDRPIKKNRRNR